MPMLSDTDLPQQLKANAPAISSNLDSSTTKHNEPNELKEARDEALRSNSKDSILDKDANSVKEIITSGSTGNSLIPGLPGLSHQSFGLTPGALGLSTVRGSSSTLTLPSMTSALLGGAAAAAAAGFGLQASALGGSLHPAPVLSTSTSSSSSTILDSSPALTQPWSLNQHLNIASGSQRLSAFTSIRPSAVAGSTRGTTSGPGQSNGPPELTKSTSMSPDGGNQPGGVTGHTAAATSLQLHPRPTGGPLSFPSPQPASPAAASDHLTRMGGSHTPGVAHPTLTAMYHPSMLSTYPDFPLPPGLPPLCKYVFFWFSSRSRGCVGKDLDPPLLQWLSPHWGFTLLH